MERETKTLKTPSGKELIVKTYLTGRENRAIRIATTKNGTEESYFAIEDEMIKQAVVSYGGTSEKIVERLLDENNDDYQFVISEITGLIVKKNQSETKSDMNSSDISE